jgi:hypothetical protein
MARFQKGQSGNPKGRPPKSEALRDLLRQALEGEINTPTGPVSGKALLARLVVEAVTTGAVHFPADQEASVLGVKDWVEFLKWAYNTLNPRRPRCSTARTRTVSRSRWCISTCPITDGTDERPTPAAR